VTVGRSPPRPKHAGPGSAPALAGPTCRRPPASTPCGPPAGGSAPGSASFVQTLPIIGTGVIVDDPERNVRERIDTILLARESFRRRCEGAHVIDVVIR